MTGGHAGGKRRQVDRFALAIAGLLTCPALFLAFLWWMSPLGLGFSGKPADPVLRVFAHQVYVVSYLGGIPMVLLAQLVGIVLAIMGRGRLALWTSGGSIALFAGGMMLALWLNSLP